MEHQDLINSARSMQKNIPNENLKELVAKSRWTCDSHWMMAMVMNAGWDIANKMNLQVAKTVGNVEMLRLMKLLNIDKPRDVNEAMMLITLAMETFITQDYFDYEFRLKGEGKGVGIIKQCYAYTKVKSINVDKDYECGCFGLRQGWYQAMGLEVEEKLVKCLKDGDEQCEIIIDKVVFPETARILEKV